MASKEEMYLKNVINFETEDRKKLIGQTIVPDSYCYEDYVVDLLNGYCYRAGQGKQKQLS